MSSSRMKAPEEVKIYNHFIEQNEELRTKRQEKTKKKTIS